MKILMLLIVLLAMSGCKSSPKPAKTLDELGFKHTKVLTQDSVVVSESELEKPVGWIIKISPKYPKNAFEKKINGKVDLEIVINEAGRVIDVQVISSEPEGVFEDAAIEAIKKWAFRPNKHNGEFVIVRSLQTVVFDNF